MALTKVFEPIRIAGCTIPNRVLRTAHATGIGRGTINDDWVAYHERRARGGCGLSILEILSVHHTSMGPLNMIDPGLDAGYAKLLEAIEPHGMKVFQQLWHAGHHGMTLDGDPPWSASDVANPVGGQVPLAMTKGMIDEIVGAYAATAARCEKAGLQGVEVHCAHGYLIQQFLSANTNRREDDYGGSFENRARFMMDVMRAVRAATSKDFAVGVRLAPDATVGGVDVEQNILAAELLEAEGLIDFVNVSLGSYTSYHKIVGGMHEPVGYEVPTSAPITARVTVPTMLTGRFRTLEEADQAIRAGEADMIGMTRAHIADPDIVRKTRAGKPEEVRPCIACNQGCVAGFLERMSMSCAINVETGAELRLDQDRIGTAEEKKKVVVVGGGPAGMEAARVAALRGHDVILFEASPRLGGAINLAAMLPKRHGIADVTVWMEQEVFRLGVDVRLSSYVDGSDILAEKPDAVIVATGSMPRMDGVQLTNPGEAITGLDQPHVLSSTDFLTDNRNWKGKHAVVLDDNGHYEAIGIAEQLVTDGADVTFVTPLKTLAFKVDNALMVDPALERIGEAEGRFTQFLRHRIRTIDSDTVELAPTHAGPSFTVKGDTVILVTPNAALREVFDELEGKVATLVIAGDAKSPRNIQKAIYDGHLAARHL